MFTIRVRRKRPGERWATVVDEATAPARAARLQGVEASEADLFLINVTPPVGETAHVRVTVGSVVVASTRRTDRVLLLEPDDEGEPGAAALTCKGNLLADWAGLTELAVEVLGSAGAWEPVLVLPLAVTAGKIAAEQFNQLFADLGRDAAAVLLDVHGKTKLGLRETSVASTAPAAVLTRVRETVHELDGLLHRIARQPASRLRTHFYREQALVGQAVSDATLVEACSDPGMLARRGDGVVFREHLREHSKADYRLPEHQLLADFGEYLKAQLSDLRQRIDTEIIEREDRKRWRNRPTTPGEPTWWETEDGPRIEELRRCREEAAALHGVIGSWAALHFLPPGRGLREKPQPTPLVLHHALYRRAFRAIAGHFQAYEVTLDVQPLLARARSLPVLYEWWCAVRVTRILAAGLTPVQQGRPKRSFVSTQLAQTGTRFTIEFAADQAIDFTDSRGNLVRFRYQPVYSASAATLGVALLDPGAVRTPDLALEVYTGPRSVDAAPDLIVILDAKYSSAPQHVKLQEVSSKYAKIGDPVTGRILSRQVWALTPAGRDGGGARDSLASYCTVDNRAFWSSSFDADNPVNGAVQTRPTAPGVFDPLRNLIVSLLRLAGVDYVPGA
jgi:hypothetical protein